MLVLVVALLASLTAEPKVIPLVGLAGMGHACPTTKAVYTAAHVAESKGAKHSYRTPFGNTRTLWVDTVVDLATISLPEEDKVGRYEIATTLQEG